MAVFTFLLFFLYPRFSSGQIDPLLFQVTLALIVFTIFSFGVSGLYYYGLVGILKMGTDRKADLLSTSESVLRPRSTLRYCSAGTDPIHNRTYGFRPRSADPLAFVHLLNCASGERTFQPLNGTLTPLRLLEDGCRSG